MFPVSGAPCAPPGGALSVEGIPNAASGEFAVLLVGKRAIHANRAALKAHNAFFRSFFRQHGDCEEVRLHHTRYAAAEAAVRLCESGQDESFFRICRRVREAGEAFSQILFAETSQTRTSTSADRGRHRSTALKEAAREYRSRFKDVLSLMENCIRYQLVWHADRAGRVVDAHLDRPAHALLALRASLSLCEAEPNFLERVARTLRCQAPRPHASSSLSSPPSSGSKAPAWLILCACLRRLSSSDASSPLFSDPELQTQWHASLSAYPVIFDLLDLAAATQTDTYTEATPSAPPDATASSLSATPSSIPSTTSMTTGAADAASPPDAETDRVGRLIAQMQPIVRAREHAVRQEADAHAQALAVVRNEQVRTLERRVIDARTALSVLAARVEAETATQERLREELTAREEAWLTRCQYLDDMHIYTTALTTAAEEIGALVAESEAALRAVDPTTDTCDDDMTQACISLYEAHARALRQSREITLRRIAAEEAEQEEREAQIAALRQ